MGNVAAVVSPAGPGELDDGPDHEGPSADLGGPGKDLAADRSVDTTQRHSTVRSWPLLVLAAPAAVAAWSGWVGIGQMTGFGEIHPLPGIWDSLHLNTAVTLPIGVESHAAFPLRVWLTSSPVVSERTRQFARRSGVGALMLGMAGQVAYHLLVQAGLNRAPWEITTMVACLPVLVLGMGSAQAHLLRGDSAKYVVLRPCRLTSGMQSCGYATGHAARDKDYPIARPASDNIARPPARVRIADAQVAAATVIASGQSVSRRSLRAAATWLERRLEHACSAGQNPATPLRASGLLICGVEDVAAFSPGC